MCKLTLLHTCLALADLKRSGRMTAVSINDVLEFMALVVLPWATLLRSWKMLIKLLLRLISREPPRHSPLRSVRRPLRGRRVRAASSLEQVGRR